MTTLNEIYTAIANDIEQVDGVKSSLDHRPRTFNTSPLFYLDVPTFDQARMGRGNALTPMSVEFDGVLIISAQWQPAAQPTLRDLMVPVFHKLRAVSVDDGTTISVGSVRGLRPGQFTEEDEGLPVGPVGAVFPIQIETKL